MPGHLSKCVEAKETGGAGREIGLLTLGVEQGQRRDAMRGLANEMALSVEQTRQSAANTASGAEQSARDLVAVASATETLAGSVGEISGQVADASRAAREPSPRT